jgi:hypothetical protein
MAIPRLSSLPRIKPQKAAKDLKERFPMLQVKIYEAEGKRSQKVELAAA